MDIILTKESRDGTRPYKSQDETGNLIRRVFTGGFSCDGRRFVLHSFLPIQWICIFLRHNSLTQDRTMFPQRAAKNPVRGCSGILFPGGNTLRRKCFHFTGALALAALLIPSAFTAEKAELGDVHFPISCKAEVQSSFDYGLALLHSFEFREAEEVFRTVESADSKCVIAAWGIALSTTERNGANAPQKDLAKGWAELQPWLAIPAGTEREQMYVNAVRAMYEGSIKHLVMSGGKNISTACRRSGRSIPMI